MLLVVIPHGNLSANLASHSTTYTPAHAFTQPPKNRIYVTPFTDALLLHCTSTSTAQYSSGQRQSIPRQVCTASLVIVAYYDDVKRKSAGHASRVSAHHTTLSNSPHSKSQLPLLRTPHTHPHIHTFTSCRCRSTQGQVHHKCTQNRH